MPDSPAPPYSLRKRLLWLLLAAIMATAVIQGGVAYRSASDEADEIFDYHMQQMALSLRAGLPSQGPPRADEGGESDADEDFVVQVWTQNGLRIFESTARAYLPQRAVMGFANVPANGTIYRVFSLQAHGQVVQVAQDMAVRRHLAGAMALRTLVPVTLMAPVLMLLAWWSVGFSLRPLTRVRRELTQRKIDDLQGIEEQGLPDELQPLVRDLNQLLLRLRAAFDAQTHFVADAAHELRSPLAALKLQVQAAQRAGDASTRAIALQRLGGGIDRATRLVEQLLTLARQQAAPGAQATAVVPADLLREIVAQGAGQAHERQIELGLSAACPMPIAGHAEALRILMRNLLDNAIKYTPAGGSIDTSLVHEPQGLVLRVEDSGPGIAESERERVLDRFYRTPDAQGSPGSGLGLAIVKSIADLHGATVRLDRSARLGGLSVAITFAPLNEAAAQR